MNSEEDSERVRGEERGKVKKYGKVSEERRGEYKEERKQK